MKSFGIVILLSLSLLAGGCASVKIPPKLTPAERDLVQATKIHAVVGVQTDEYPVYSNKLADALRRTGLFDEVALIDDLQREPDLIATVEKHVYGAPGIPVFALLTFGVIPSSAEETHGYVFSLRPARTGAAPVLLDVRYSGKTTLGWVALLMNLSTQRTIKDPYKTDRLNDTLKAAIAKRAGEIQALIPGDGGGGGRAGR
ncbi:MAG TPA: hypothetical protein VF789_26490 [Thermoanaerobaculia bacterium]